MSLIRLRQRMRRSAGPLAVVLLASLAVLVAAHHSLAHDQHVPSGAATTGHHEPAMPASAMDQAVELCLAVLPFLAVMAAALAMRLALRLRGPVGVIEPASRASRAATLRRARDGPRVLCVVRC